MPAPLEEANVADRSRLLSSRALLESVLLNIRESLHAECDRKEYDRNNVRCFPKAGLRVLQHVRRVQNSDRHADRPHPQHLKDPEAEEREELVSLVVKSVVAAGLEDAEEQESRETRRPKHDEDAGDDLASIGRSGHAQCDDCQYHEIRSSHEVGELVKF